MYLVRFTFLKFGDAFMKVMLICVSYHHKNTEQVASVFAKTLDAALKSPFEVNPSDLSEYDLIGLGSGIYFSKHHKTLLNFADNLPPAHNRKAFIFSTSGQEGRVDRFHRQLREKLQAKGYNIIGEFNCPGIDTYGITKLVGGIKKGRPNQEDLQNAKAFAQTLKQQA